MKPEEKYFVIKGIYEDRQTWTVDKGYWVIRKRYGTGRGSESLSFFKNKKEADDECEKLREKYKLAIAYIKEGDNVWFINEYYIQHRKVIDIINIGYDIYYVMEETDTYLNGDKLFKSKQELLDYLDKHINE